MQKFQTVVATAIHLFPTHLDFWLISAYAELDVRGSLDGSRKIILNGLRRNEKPRFYLAYFEFELRFLEKMSERQEEL